MAVDLRIAERVQECNLIALQYVASLDDLCLLEAGRQAEVFEFDLGWHHSPGVIFGSKWARRMGKAWFRGVSA